MNRNAVLTLRPADDDDEPFLKNLSDIINSERLAFGFVNIDPDEKNKILDHQFKAHQTHYLNVDMDKKDCIILVDNEPVGRLILIQNGQEIRLADLAILPQYRRSGIATAAIQGILGESVQSQRPVTLHVHKYSEGDAFRLYQRLGFVVIEDRTTHYFMEWNAAKMSQ